MQNPSGIEFIKAKSIIYRNDGLERLLTGSRNSNLSLSSYLNFEIMNLYGADDSGDILLETNSFILLEDGDRISTE